MSLAREAKIRQALVDHMAQVGLTLNLPVSWPSDNFDPDVTGNFLIFSYVPNISERPYMGTEEEHIYNGIVQIDVMSPLGRLYADHAMQIASQVVALFPEDAPMRYDDVTVMVTKRGDIVQGYRDFGMWRTPISIRWQCLA